MDASIGVARYPADGEDAQTLLRRADIAMYSAKAERDGHRFYAHGQDCHSVSRLSMVGDFRRALEQDDQIVVHFQPIIDLGTRAGFTALRRWCAGSILSSGCCSPRRSSTWSSRRA